MTFRVWDGKTLHYLEKDYHYYLSFNSVDIWTLWWQNNGKDKKIASHHEGHILQQYTGLNDMHGNKIYEGDYLRGKDGIQRHKVKYIDGGFYVKEDHYYSLASNHMNYYKVGNIFETEKNNYE